ncbi:acylphosphatase-2-like [Phymastichus coffea]|uniref:acylphosphatase-2-like n=1 Tax=Phymastichus coffea TaxID=108790 RepID=UPI00273AB3E0|nr:acylphosphatase-2-like [Phymastichus coffea]
MRVDARRCASMRVDTRGSAIGGAAGYICSDSPKSQSAGQPALAPLVRSDRDQPNPRAAAKRTRTIDDMASADPLALEPLVSVEFEVFGRVQACSFTRYVRDLCQQLGIVGWVKNTRAGTILGKMQGPQALVDQMANWLSTVGSPDSNIHHCEFRDLCSVAKPGYKGFQVRF